MLSGYRGLKESAQRMPASERAQVKHAAGRLTRLYAAWGKPEAEHQWQNAALQ